VEKVAWKRVKRKKGKRQNLIEMEKKETSSEREEEEGRRAPPALTMSRKASGYYPK